MDVPLTGPLLTRWLIYCLSWSWTSAGVELDFTGFPLSKLEHAYCFLPVFPKSQPPGPATSKLVYQFSMVWPREEHPVSLNHQCSNYRVETNSLSIFSTFNPQLLVIFSFFCIGSHGNKSVGRASVTLLLAFCTLQNPSSDPQASIIIKGQEETNSLANTFHLFPYHCISPPTPKLATLTQKTAFKDTLQNPLTYWYNYSKDLPVHLQNWIFWFRIPLLGISDFTNMSTYSMQCLSWQWPAGGSMEQQFTFISL